MAAVLPTKKLNPSAREINIFFIAKFSFGG
jgi:hypothetical protein